MILQGNQNQNRRLVEENYRRELFNEIQEKQTMKNKSRIIENSPQTEQFGLIKNIETEQERRTSKRKQYYAELQQQRQEALRKKKEKEEEQKRYQRQMDEKIEKENEMLKQRYAEQIRKQKGKKQTVQENTRRQPPPPPPPQKKFREEQLQPKYPERVSKQQLTYPQDSLDQISSQNQYQDNRQRDNYQQFPNHIYASRAENQQFNFVPRRNFNTGYYQDLVMEKRRFQQETSSLRELNRMLGAEKNYQRKPQKTGIESLRQLQKLLEDQSAGYLNEQSDTKSNYNKGRAKTYNSTSYFDF